MKKFFTLFAFIFFIPFLNFAQGSFDHWPLSGNGWHTIDTGITVIEEENIKTQGTSSASVEVTTGTQASTDLRTDLDVVSGQTYDICFDIYHTEGHLKARIYADNYYNYSDNTLTNQWQTICKTITPSTTETIEVGLRFYDQTGFDGSEIVYVDNLTVNGGILPVLFNYFNAEKNDNTTLISWQTLTETNNDYFSLEWSKDGKNFTEIAKIAGAGTSREKQNYSYTHTNPLNGVNYYRLTQYDFDGRSESFDVVSVTLETDKLGMLIAPNRVENNLRIEFTEPVENGRLHIYNMGGQSVQSFILARGIDIFNFDISGMVKGQYIAKYIDDKGIITKKFLKI